MWLKPSGEPADSVSMKNAILNNESVVYVGTDSHSFGRIWIFATVVCCHIPGRGGRFYTKRQKFERNKFLTLADRLLHEAFLSIEAAQEVEELTGKKPKIHIDVSKKDASSAKFHKNISSYVTGMGYEVASKPDAWASSSVADRQAR